MSEYFYTPRNFYTFILPSQYSLLYIPFSSILEGSMIFWEARNLPTIPGSSY